MKEEIKLVVGVAILIASVAIAPYLAIPCILGTFAGTWAAIRKTGGR